VTKEPAATHRSFMAGQTTRQMQNIIIAHIASPADAGNQPTLRVRRPAITIATKTIE